MRHEAHRHLAAMLTTALLWTALTGCRRVESPPSPATSPRIVIESAGKTLEKAMKQVPSKQDLRMVAGATAEEVGIVFYPGATVVSSELIRNGRNLTAGAKLTTRDEHQKVLNFYRQRYHSPDLKEKQTDGSEGKQVWLNWQDPQGNHTIALWRDDAHKQTIITLARIKAPRQ